MLFSTGTLDFIMNKSRRNTVSNTFLNEYQHKEPDARASGAEQYSGLPGYQVHRRGLQRHRARRRPAARTRELRRQPGARLRRRARTQLPTGWRILPGAPSPGGGNVVVVPGARVQLLDAPLNSARRTMKQRGLGLLQLAAASTPAPIKTPGKD